MSSVQRHFNDIAEEYDYWKNKNWYYYKNLENILKEIIPLNSKILDYGCGTGNLLHLLKPGKGIGIDISDEMIKIAKTKYFSQNNLEFFTLENPPKDTFDYIIMVDLIEHLENINDTFLSIKYFCNKNTKIVILMANPLWEPVLLILEKLKLKMPEGPHFRISLDDLKKTIEQYHFMVKEHKYRQILPKHIYKISDKINSLFYKIPLIKNLGLTEIIILENQY